MLFPISLSLQPPPTGLPIYLFLSATWEVDCSLVQRVVKALVDAGEDLCVFTPKTVPAQSPEAIALTLLVRVWYTTCADPRGICDGEG